MTGFEGIQKFDELPEEVKEAYYSLDWDKKIEYTEELIDALPDDFPQEERKKIQLELMRLYASSKLAKSSAMKMFEKFNVAMGWLILIVFCSGILYLVYKVVKYFVVKEALFEYQIPVYMIVGSAVVFVLYAIFAIVVGLFLKKLAYFLAWISWVSKK